LSTARTLELAPGPALSAAPAPAAAYGSSSQFDALYDEHFAFVWRLLRVLGVDEASVPDALQDVFVVVFRRLGEFEGRASVRTWLFRIALRVASNHRRSRGRNGNLVPIPDGALATGPGPAEAVESAQALRIVDEVLSEMPEAQRDVFMLAELEQMTAPEIAEVLDVKLNTVYSRLRLAREQFNRQIARRLGREP
jgi:RNA polymerase sigma-70 factor (ECF subfamily)